MRRATSIRKAAPTMVAVIIAVTSAFVWTYQATAVGPLSPYTPTGEVIHPPVAQLPSNCKGLFAGFTCRSDSDFEYSLEQQYWGHLGNGEYDELKDWMGTTKWYLLVVKGLGNAERARLETFLAFSHVGQFVQGANDDPLNLTNVLAALVWIEKAKIHNPDSANHQALEHYLKSYVGFALGSSDAGHNSIAELYAVTEKYGPVVGSEGQVVGAMGQMLLQDPTHVQTGLTTLNNCDTTACRRNSAIAPYKEIGMQIAIGEGYARLGNTVAMDEAFDRARAYATQYDYPTPEIIETSYLQLTGPGGAIDQWQNDPGNLGEILLPLPPSAGALACQSCHTTGQNPYNKFDGIPDPGPLTPPMPTTTTTAPIPTTTTTAPTTTAPAGLACSVSFEGNKATVTWTGQGQSDFVIVYRSRSGSSKTKWRGKQPSPTSQFVDKASKNKTFEYSIRTKTGSTKSAAVSCS